jgi:hypothetical protein
MPSTISQTNGTMQKTPRRNRTKHAEVGFVPYGAEMRPPFEVELWKPVDDTPHLLAVAVSFEAAEKAYQEAVANLRLGEVVPCGMPSVRCCFLPTRMNKGPRNKYKHAG